MPTVIRHHKITKGADHWVNSPKREQLFDSIGVTNIRTLVDPQDPTRVAAIMDVSRPRRPDERTKKPSSR
jgi:hypothetical protein